MELASLLRRTAIVGSVTYFVIMFPPIRTTYPDLGMIGGEPTGKVEVRRDFVGMVPSSDDDYGTGIEIEIEWRGYLAQLAVAPVVGFILFRPRRKPPAWEPASSS